MNRGSKVVVVFALVAGMLLSTTPLGLDPWNGPLGDEDDGSVGSADGIAADTTAPVISRVFQTPQFPGPAQKVNVTAAVFDESVTNVTVRYGYDNSTWTDLPTTRGKSLVFYEDRVPATGLEDNSYVIEKEYYLRGELAYIHVDAYRYYTIYDTKVRVSGEYQKGVGWYQVGIASAELGQYDPGGFVLDRYFDDPICTRFEIFMSTNFRWEEKYFNCTYAVLEDSHTAWIPAAGTRSRVYYYFNATDASNNSVESQVYSYGMDSTDPVIKDHTEVSSVHRGGRPKPIYANVTDDMAVDIVQLNWTSDNATWHQTGMGQVTGSATSGQFMTHLGVPSRNTTFTYRVEVTDQAENGRASPNETLVWNPPPRISPVTVFNGHLDNRTVVNVSARAEDQDDGVSTVWVMYAGDSGTWRSVAATNSSGLWKATIPAVNGTDYVSYRFHANDTDGGTNGTDPFRYLVDEDPPDCNRMYHAPNFPGWNTTVNVTAHMFDESGPVVVTAQYSYDNSTWTTLSTNWQTVNTTYYESDETSWSGTIKGTFDLTGELQHLHVTCPARVGAITIVDCFNESTGYWENILYEEGYYVTAGAKVHQRLDGRNYTKWRVTQTDTDTPESIRYNATVIVMEDTYTATVPAAGDNSRVYVRFNSTDSLGLGAMSDVYAYDIDHTAPVIHNHSTPVLVRSTEPLPIFTNVSDDNRLMSAWLNWSTDNQTWTMTPMEKKRGDDESGKFKAPLPVPSRNTTYYFRIFAYDEPLNEGNSSLYTFHWNPPPWIENVTYSPAYVNDTSLVEVSASLWDADGVSAMWVVYSANQTNWSRVNGSLSGGKWRATVPAHNGTDQVYYHVWAQESDGGVNESQMYSYPVDRTPPEFHDVLTVPALVNHTTSPTLLAGVTDVVGINNSSVDYRFNWSAGWTTLGLTPPPPLASNLSVSAIASWSLYGVEGLASRLGYYDGTISGIYEHEVPEWALPYYTDVVVIEIYGSWGAPTAIKAASAGAYVLVSSSVWGGVLDEMGTSSYNSHGSHDFTSKGIPVGKGAVISLTTYGFGNPIGGIRNANASRLDDLALHMRSAYLVYAAQRATIPQTGNQTTVFYRVHSTDLSRITNGTGVLNYTTDGVPPTVNAARGAPSPPYWGEDVPYPVWVNASDDRMVKGARVVWSFDQGSSWHEGWLPISRGNDTTKNISGNVPPPGFMTKVRFHYLVQDEALNTVRYPAGTSYYEYGTTDAPAFTDLDHDRDWVLENQVTHITVNVTDGDGLDQVVLRYRLEHDDWSEVGMVHVSGPTWRGAITSPSSSGRMFYRVWARDALGVENASQVRFYWVEGSGPHLYLTHIEPVYPGSNDTVSVHGNVIDRMSNVTAWYDYRYGETGTVSTLNATGGATVSGTVTTPSTYGALEYTHDLGKELTHLKIDTYYKSSATHMLHIEGYIEELDAWDTILYAENTTGYGTQLDMDLKGYGYTKWRMYFKQAGGAYVRASATYTAVDPDHSAQVPPPGDATWVYYRLRATDSYGHNSSSEWGRYWADGVLPWLVDHTEPSHNSSITGVNVTATFADDTRMGRAELHYDIGLGYHSVEMEERAFNGTHLTANATIPPTFIPMNATYFFRMFDESGNVNDSRPFTVQTALLDAVEGVTYWFNASRLVDPSDIKAVAWDMDYGGTFSADKTGVNVSHSFSDNGTLQMAVRITDNSDKDRTWIFDVTVLDNSPTAYIQWFQPLKEGDQGDFKGTQSTSPADAIVKYEWDFDYNGTFTTDLTGSTVKYTYMDDGIYVVALRVTDDDGSTDIATRSREVDDKYPDVRLAYPQEAYQGAVVEFNASRTVSFPDDVVSILWDFNYNGTFRADANGTVVTHVYMKEGHYLGRVHVTDDDGSMREGYIGIDILDGVPTANITVEGQTVEGQQFTLNATASESYPDALVSYEWDLSYNGTFVQEATGPLLNVTIMDSGVLRVALRLTDEDGSVVVLERSIDVLDGVPTVVLEGPDLVDEGDTVQFNASRSSSYPDAIVAFEWDLDYRGTFDVDLTGAVVNHTYMKDGNYTVALRVRDDDGSNVTAFLEVTVLDLGPEPVIEVRWQRVEGSELVFDGGNSTSYPDDVRRMEWDVDYQEGDFVPELFGTKVFHTYYDSGVHVLALRVIDIDGSAAIATLELDIADLGPEVGIGTSSEQVLEGSPIVFVVDRLDTNPDDLVRFDWDWDGDGRADETTYEPQATHRFDAPGERTVMLEVVDEDGSKAHTFRTVTVTNVGPTAVLQIEDAAEGQEAHLYGGGSQEPGDDIVDFRWDMDGDGAWDASTDGTINWTWYSAGAHTVALEVEDEAGATHRVTGTVIITDVAPTADDGGPYEVPEGQPLVLSAGGSSEPGDDITDYSWDLDGDGIAETTSDGPELAHVWDEPGKYNLMLEVTDEEGSTGTSYFVVTVLDTPPTFDLVLPADVMEGVPAEFAVVNLLDPGTAEFVVTWWFGDGEKGTGPSVVHTYASPGSYAGHVTVRDNDGTVSRVDWSDPLVVANSAPRFTLDSHTWNLTEDEPFTFDLVAWDPHGSRLTYSFEGRGGKIDPDTGRFTWTPTDADVGNHTLTFYAEDEGGAVGSVQVEVNVRDVGGPEPKPPDGDDDPSGPGLAMIAGVAIAIVAAAVATIALVLRRRESRQPVERVVLEGSETTDGTELDSDDDGPDPG